MLDNLTRLHYEQAIGEARLDFGRVADQEHRNARLLFQSLQQVEKIGPAARVEVSGRLVGDQESRIAREGLREDDALALASAQLVRISGKNSVGLAQADAPEHGLRFSAAALPWPVTMSVNDLGNLLPDAHHGAQGDSRLLINNRDCRSADSLESAFIEREQVQAAESSGTGDFHAIILKQAKQGQSSGGFAAAGFAHEAQGFARGDVERKGIYGSILLPAIRAIVDCQVANLEQAFHKNLVVALDRARAK